MSDWGDMWPDSRVESHYGDRVVPCFVQRPHSLYALLQEATNLNPDGEAIVCGSHRLRYRDLYWQSTCFAMGLSKRGVVAGDRIALLLGNRHEFVVTLFAIARLGAIAVPISTREQAPGVAYMLAHCGASVVVHEPDLGHLLPLEEEAQALKFRIAIGSYEGSECYDAWMDASTPTPVVDVQEEDTAVILYTSGTTGRPKGAMLTHLGIVHSSMHYKIAMGLSDKDCSIAAVPLSHVTGLVASITTLILSAGKLVIMPNFKAVDFLHLAELECMTHTLMVPAMYNLCLLQTSFEELDLSKWRIGGFGGAPMPIATIDNLTRIVPSLTLMNCYGSTETTSPSTLMPRGHAKTHTDSVGIALACVEMRVMDDLGYEVPHGDLGEIWIKGPMVVPGYWENSTANAENFTAGFWHSGDIGAIDESGYVKVVDRKKDMINRGGYKIYTIEVENVLYAHPAVQECAVVSKPCAVLGERVHAFVMLKEQSVAEAELAEFCRSRLSDYKVPESFTLSTTGLPRNANGKLVKRDLRDQLNRSLVV
ncbi:MAG: acyl--CoA ligase [Burkholderiales bacterium]|jgi:long-chain acyl-CoA synthetase|nr:acyl--CoA ligase [Burkholderiales bacterium]